RGKKAGPPEILAGLITRWMPTQTVKIDIQDENGTLTATVGSVGQIKSQRLTNEAGQPMTMLNTGLTTALQFDNQAAQLAPALGRNGLSRTCRSISNSTLAPLPHSRG